ncbi:MAG: AsmA-like C-terminal region-containing protein, partial [Vicinamibacterales bacterium]
MRRILLAVVVLVVVLASTTAAAVYWLLSGDGVRAALERQATAWLGQPVRIGSADAQLFPRIGVQLTDVHVGDPARVTLGSVEVSTGLRALLSRRIENADVILANSRIDMPLPFELPTSGSTGEEPDWQIVSMRTIRLDDVVVSSRGREVTVSVDSSLAGDTLALTRIRASASGTTVDGSGAVRLAPALDARLDLSANTLDLDDLLALAEAFAPGGGGRRTASSADGRLVAEVRADSVTAGRLTVPQFSTTVRVHGTRVSLSPTRFLLFGGRYEGDLDLALSEAGAMTLVSRVRDINVAELAAFGGVPDAITGRLSGSGRFEGRGTALAEVMATARGGGSATIADGSIRGLNLVRTVVLFLGRPAPDTAAATDSFDRIDTTFSLASQVVTADALSLQSRDADIVATGTLALETKALDGRADLSLSEELSKQAGTDLYRYTREGNRIVLPATIGGTLGAP